MPLRFPLSVPAGVLSERRQSHLSWYDTKLFILVSRDVYIGAKVRNKTETGKKLQVFIGLTTNLTDLTDEKGEWVGEIGAHTEKIFGRTDGTDNTDFGSR